MSNIFLHQHFFDFATDAEYFRSNDAVYHTPSRYLIGVAFYEFDFDAMTAIIMAARSKCEKLIVYIKEPFSPSLIKLVKNFATDQHTKFFGDAVLNEDLPNWQPAISWFVSPRHYYQKDDWAKDLLAKVDLIHHDRPYKFDCLLGTPKPHRDSVAQHYLDSSVKNQILFSYFRDQIHQGIWDQDIGDTQATWQPFEFLPSYHVALSALVPYGIYNQSHHSIVAESTAYDEFNHVTEKIAKPMMAQRIFIVFAGQHYLRSLRTLGFQTFGEIIDESYDEQACALDRYRMAWQEVEKLCLQDANTVRHRVQKALEHNRKLFLESDWHHNVKSHILRCQHQLQVNL